MLGWLIRIVMVLAGAISSWFMGRDALKFPIVQMIIAVFLITLLLVIIAFWPIWKNYYRQLINKNKNS